MPEISSFYGIIISMFFSDHNPPHFHVKYQGYEATIDIATGTVKGQLPRRASTWSMNGSTSIRTSSWPTGPTWRTQSRLPRLNP